MTFEQCTIHIEITKSYNWVLQGDSTHYHWVIGGRNDIPSFNSESPISQTSFGVSIFRSVVNLGSGVRNLTHAQNTFFSRYGCSTFPVQQGDEFLREWLRLIPKDQRFPDSFLSFLIPILV